MEPEIFKYMENSKNDDELDSCEETYNNHNS
jgi:hypothetical protein